MAYTDEELLAWTPTAAKEPKDEAKPAGYSDEELLAWKPVQPASAPETTEQPYDPRLTSAENQAAWTIAKSPVPTIRGGILAGGARMLSGAYRVGELLPEDWGGRRSKEQADWFANYSKALTKAAEVAGDQGVVKRGLTGALSSAPQMLAAGPLGVAGMIGAGVADSANMAVTEGRQAGLRGKELSAYVGRQGAIEGVVTGAMQKIGLGGIEKVLPGAFSAARSGVRQAVSQSMGAGLKTAAKQTARTLGEEELEEVVIGAAQMWDDKYSGVDKSKWSLDQVARTFADTTSAVVWTTLGGAGPIHLAQNVAAGRQAQIENEIATTAEQGKTPTRKQWKDWGLDPKMGKDAQSRAEGVQQVTEQLRQQYEPQQPVAEETQQTAPQEAPEAAIQPEAAGQLPTEPELAQARPEVAAEGLRQKFEVSPELLSQPELPPQEVATTQPQDLVETTQPEVWTEPEAPKQKGEIAQFIESSAGRIGISADALSKPVGFLKHAAQRFFTSQGDLPISVYNEKVKTNGRLAKQMLEMRYDLVDWKNALKETYPGRKPSKEEIRAFGMALRGEVPYEALPPPLRQQIGKMRLTIDAMSREAVRTGAVEGPLASTFLDNEGMYVYRGYRAHTDPKWAEKVPVEKRNQAKAWIRGEYPNKTDAEVDGLIAHLLYEGKAADTPIAALASKLGKKDVTILEKRKDIPRALRELWGEENDPTIIYAQTVTHMASLIENHKFLAKIRQEGLGTFFSEVPTINETGELKVRIAADESSAMAPLNGLYTTPEIRDAFTRATSAQNNPAWLAYLYFVNGTVKLSKTVLSVAGVIRNNLGNIPIAIANGHFDPTGIPHAYKTVFADLLNKPDEQLRAYYARATELGLAGDESIHAEEMKRWTKDVLFDETVREGTSEEIRRSKTLRAVSGVFNAAGRVYQGSDTAWKLNAWEVEKADYQKAYPEWTQTQIEEVAAAHVRNGYPTWSKVPEGIRAFRRNLLTGTFVSFPAEIIRTTYHIAQLAKTELGNPRTRSIGAKRAAGLVAAMLIPDTVATISRFVTGMSREDDKDFRWFVAPWQKNSALMYALRRGALIRFVDFGYSDPHNYLTNPVRSLLSGKGDLKDRAWDGLQEFARPFVGEEILFKAFTEAWRNNKGGTKVYNPQDSINQQAAAITEHLWKAFEPGTVTSLKRVYHGLAGSNIKGKQYNAGVEVAALLTGQRMRDIDIRESLKFRARDYAKQWRDAQSIWLGTITNRGSASDSEIQSAYQKADRARQGLFKDMSEATQAAVRLGVAWADVGQSLDIGGISDDEIEALQGGYYRPIRLSAQNRHAIQQANPSEAARRLQMVDRLLESQAAVPATPK